MESRKLLRAGKIDVRNQLHQKSANKLTSINAINNQLPSTNNSKTFSLNIDHCTDHRNYLKYSVYILSIISYQYEIFLLIRIPVIYLNR